MRTTRYLALVLLLCLPAAATAAALPSRPALAFSPGEVVVVTAPGTFARSAGDAGARAASAALAATLDRLGLGRAEDLRRATPPGARRVEIVRLFSGRAGFDPRAAAAALRSQPGVLGAAPNLHLRLDLVPNDPYFSSQWCFGNSAAAIHAQQGWARSTGAAGVVIAILDTGADTGHADLASKIWTNPGEIPANGIDDEGDGFADDVHGWDFGDADADPRPVPMFDAVFGIDEGWHGTFVAGLAAAATNNGVGTAGVAWGCRILPLKVNDSAGDIPLTALVGAFDYAIAQHADVINLSLGTTDLSAAAFFQPLIDEAFDADIVCVAAAGNEGTDTPSWPAACDSVLAVASTNAANVRSDWSNWGGYVDLCAPGEAMWSCIADNYVYDETSQLFFEILWGWDTVNPYMQNDGTSFAAPLVSGAAALVRSLSPAMTAQQVMAMLVTSGDVKVYDNPIGPKLNLDRALTYIADVEPAVAPARGVTLSASPNPAAGPATLRFGLPAGGRARLVILDAAGRRVRTLEDAALAAGTRAIAWDLRDERGAHVRAGLYFAHLEAGGARLTRRFAVIR
jgi:subtilisin family serine protease